MANLDSIIQTVIMVKTLWDQLMTEEVVGFISAFIKKHRFVIFLLSPLLIFMASLLYGYIYYFMAVFMIIWMVMWVLIVGYNLLYHCREVKESLFNYDITGIGSPSQRQRIVPDIGSPSQGQGTVECSDTFRFILSRAILIISALITAAIVVYLLKHFCTPHPPVPNPERCQNMSNVGHERMLKILANPVIYSGGCRIDLNRDYLNLTWTNGTCPLMNVIDEIKSEWKRLASVIGLDLDDEMSRCKEAECVYKTYKSEECSRRLLYRIANGYNNTDIHSWNAIIRALYKIKQLKPVPERLLKILKCHNMNKDDINNMRIQDLEYISCGADTLSLVETVSNYWRELADAVSIDKDIIRNDTDSAKINTLVVLTKLYHMGYRPKNATSSDSDFTWNKVLLAFEAAGLYRGAMLIRETASRR